MAVRRWGAARGFGPGFAALLLVFGLLVATGVVQERVRERQLETDELRALVALRQVALDDLSDEVEVLTARLAEVRDREASGSAEVRGLLGEIERLRLPAAAAPVRGPGVVVELRDSPRVARTPGQDTDLWIGDRDLRTVVNALWRGGAEAVAVGDERLVSTSAIRTAGRTILVNLHPVTSPYRVGAVGDPSALRDALADVERRFSLWEQLYGLGFSIAEETDLALPGLSALPSLRWAEPAPGEEEGP